MDSFALGAALAARGWLSEQPQAFQTMIIGMGRLVELDRGDPLYHVGDTKGGVFGIVSGTIAAHGGTELQAPVLATLLRAGYWFGFGPALRGGPRALSFVAAEPTILFQVPLSRLEPMMRADAIFAIRVSQMADIGSQMLDAEALKAFAYRED